MSIHLLLFAALAAAQSNSTNSRSKQGLALMGDAPDADNEFLTSDDSPISWYYTWSPWPSDAVSDSIAFLPLLHGVEAAEDSELDSILDRLPSSSTHLLTFNEPDGEEDTGGSAISPEDAAEAYLEYVVPLRSGDGRTWNISHPVVTGSPQGLEWLEKFNESCYDLADDGCPTDFVAVHWYGDFAGLASWIGTLREFYNATNPQFWITELALPAEDEEANLAMMNESMKYLDELDDVEGYAWFGAFRTDNSNDWTGDGVSLFDDDGGLTELGAKYLGGDDNGYEAGMGGSGSATRPSFLVLLVCIAAAFM